MKFKSVLYILSACFVICSVSGHIHLSHHRKIEIAKKIGAALFFASKKRMMLPLPGRIDSILKKINFINSIVVFFVPKS